MKYDFGMGTLSMLGAWDRAGNKVNDSDGVMSWRPVVGSQSVVKAPKTLIQSYTDSSLPIHIICPTISYKNKVFRWYTEYVYRSNSYNKVVMNKISN